MYNIDALEVQTKYGFWNGLCIPYCERAMIWSLDLLGGYISWGISRTFTAHLVEIVQPFKPHIYNPIPSMYTELFRICSR